MSSDAHSLGMLGSGLVHSVAILAYLGLFNPGPVCLCLPNRGDVLIDLRLPVLTLETRTVLSSGSAVSKPAGSNLCPGPFVDNDPSPLSRVLMAPSLLPKEATADLLLCVQIGKDGQVTTAKVLQTSGQQRADRAALDKVKRLRFTPALIGGRASNFWHRLTVHRG